MICRLHARDAGAAAHSSICVRQMHIRNQGLACGVARARELADVLCAHAVSASESGAGCVEVDVPALGASCRLPRWENVGF